MTSLKILKTKKKGLLFSKMGYWFVQIGVLSRGQKLRANHQRD